MSAGHALFLAALVLIVYALWVLFAGVLFGNV